MIAPEGAPIDPALGPDWRMAPEERAFREQVLVTTPRGDGSFDQTWIPRRPIPASDLWFENVWRTYREGGIYRESTSRIVAATWSASCR